MLRPLRSINKIRGIRVIVTSLIDSIPPLANVALFLMFIIILFGILGLHLFYGMFEYRCRLTREPVNGKWPVYAEKLELCNPSRN